MANHWLGMGGPIAAPAGTTFAAACASRPSNQVPRARLSANRNSHIKISSLKLVLIRHPTLVPAQHLKFVITQHLRLVLAPRQSKLKWRSPVFGSHQGYCADSWMEETQSPPVDWWAIDLNIAPFAAFLAERVGWSVSQLP